MQNLQPCIDACAASARASRDAAAECLKSPSTLEVGRLCLDNAALCDLTVEVLARRAAHVGDFCVVNRHINQVCAAACAVLADTSETLGRCRDACSLCAAECEKHVGEADL